MRALLICVVAVSVAGCTFGAKTCSDTSECGAGATCQQGFCVAIGGETGGGNGGGTAAGGGAAQGGGAATGGGDGTGGGTTEVCPTLNCSEACVEPTGCVPYFTGIEIVSPDAGVRVQEGLLVPFVAQMVVTAGVTVTDDKLPTVLAYTDEDGGVGTWFKIANENRYRVNRTFSACGQDTVFTTMASLEDGGFPVAASVVCDGQAPTVTLPTMNDYFQRDDVKLLQLTASEPLSTATATLGGVALELADAGCTDAGPCFVMDFSKPNFPYIDAGVQLTVTASDVVGLQATIPSQTLKVTRIRWETSLPSGLPVRAAPAIAPSGAVVVGTANPTTTGTLYRLDALSGSVDGGIAVGAIQGVAVANSLTESGAVEPVVFLTFNTSVGILEGARLNTMGLLSSSSVPRAQTSSGQVTYMAPALVMTGSANGEVLAVATSTAADLSGLVESQALRWGPVGGTRSLTLGFTDGFARMFHSDRTPPVNAISLAAAQSNAMVRILGSAGAALRTILGVRGTNMTVQDGVDLDAGAVAQAGMGGSAYVSVPGGIGRPPVVVRVDAADVPVEWNGMSNNEPIGAVSIGAGNIGFVGVKNSIMTFDAASNGGVLVSAAPLSGGQTISLAPVLLSAQASSATAWGYTVSDARKLIAFDQALVAQPWEGTLRIGSSLTASHPSFGCNTKPNAADGTGVLYVGWSDGMVQAIVVDGPKLEGPWPKYQRTMGNAGNDDEVNFPTNWPSICP